MITYYKFENKAFSPLQTDGDDVVWLSVVQPTPDEIETLVATYELPEDYVTSILDDNENSRFEGFHQNAAEEPLLLLLQYPNKTISSSGYKQIDTLPFAIIMTKNNKIITVTNYTVNFVVQAQTQVMHHEQFPIQESLLLFFSWQIALSYNQHLKELILQTNHLEGELKVSTENNQLYQLMNIQKSLVYFESALQSNITVISRLDNAAMLNDNYQSPPTLHDILVEMKQASTTTSIQLKLVDKISDTFSAIVSNNLNNVMKILTSLTIVLTIPTIIGGIYGMNVKLPFENREDAFFWISAITIVTCIIAIYKLKKSNFL